jgi:TetR/AcrR family fatty acid metabolism transcriptional regulator
MEDELLIKPLSKIEQKKAQKRRRILIAATRVFARHGFQNASIAQVAQEAGVADGTIYLYFANKNELLLHIFEEAMDIFIAKSKLAMKRDHSAPERLRTIAHIHLSLLGRNEDIATVFQVELRQSIRLMKQFSQTRLRDYFKLMESVIIEGQQQGSIRPDLDSWIAVKVLFGALDEMATNWVLRQKSYALSEMGSAVIDMLLHGFCASTQTANIQNA